MSAAGTPPLCAPPAEGAISPNHGARRGVAAPDLVVLHFTGMADAASARARLCDPAAEVSAHWLLHEDGRAEALVPENRRAWHAGAGSWQGHEDINSRSIGIELVNPGDRPFAAAQTAALEILLREICARWMIQPVNVIGHSDMAPDRKFDPGPRFDWRRLDRVGLAICPPPVPRNAAGPDTPNSFNTLLNQIGYPPAALPCRLAAFRARFRPWGRGDLCPADIAQATAVATAHASVRSSAPSERCLSSRD